jgi:hypothetical protein
LFCVSSGGVAQTVVYPFDLIRRRIQMGVTAAAAAGTAGTATTGSAAASAATTATVATTTGAVSDFTWLSSVRRLVLHEGYRSAFAGIGPTYAKVLRPKTE